MDLELNGGWPTLDQENQVIKVPEEHREQPAVLS